MASERQSKFKLIEGRGEEIQPSAPLKPMPRWQWTLLWIVSITIWFFLFHYFWLALR